LSGFLTNLVNSTAQFSHILTVSNQVLNPALKNRGSSVGIVTRPGAGRPGFASRQRRRIFILSTASRPVLGA